VATRNKLIITDKAMAQPSRTTLPLWLADWRAILRGKSYTMYDLGMPMHGRCVSPTRARTIHPIANASLGLAGPRRTCSLNRSSGYALGREHVEEQPLSAAGARD